MSNITLEAKVGAFVVAALAIFLYMGYKVGGVYFETGRDYEIVSYFASVSGLKNKASVQIAGVEIGKVSDISLVGDKAKVTMRIQNHVKLPLNSVATIRTHGLLGEKFIEIENGDSSIGNIPPGGVLAKTQTPVDLDRLVTQISLIAEDVKSITASFRNVLGFDYGEESVREIVENMKALTYNINQVVLNNEDRIEQITANLEKFTKDLQEISSGNKERLSQTIANFKDFSENMKATAPEITANLKELTKNLDEMVRENRGNFKDSLENFKQASAKLEKTLDSVSSVASKIDKGEGTLGKLVNDETTHKNLNEALTGVNKFITKSDAIKLYLNYRNEYMVDSGDFKNYVGVKIQPKDDKYYLLELVDDPSGEISQLKSETKNGNTTVTKTTKEKMKVNAQIAKKFGNATIRGGLIESTGGVAADYEITDNIKLTAEIFDFNRDRNKFSNVDLKPHAKVGASVKFLKYFYATAGYDEFLNSKADLNSAFVGAGFTFEDEDLKYILGNVPLSGK